VSVSLFLQARSYRDPKYDGLYDIPTFKEFLELASNHNTVGVYPEVKDPEMHNSLEIVTTSGKRFEDIVLETLLAYGYNDANDLCFIQSFSEATTLYLANHTSLPLVMLIEEDVTDAKLDEWAALGIAGIGPWVQLVSKFYTPEHEYKNWISENTNFITRCHARGFKVHPWTLRNEDQFLAWDFQQDVHRAFDHFLTLGVDGLFTDFPGTMADHLDVLYKLDERTSTGASFGDNSLLYKFVILFTFVLGLHFNV